MRLNEEFKIVGVAASADISGGVTGDSISMKNFHHCTFILQGPTTDWTASPDIKVYSGATDGATTTAMTFSYRKGSAAIGSANCDVLAAEATSAELDMGVNSEGYMFVIEIDATEMTDTHDWLTIVLDSDASAGEIVIIAVLQTRYGSFAEKSALT